MENWLITLIRNAQAQNPAVAGLVTEVDDGGPTRADHIYASLPQHAQGAFDRLGIDRQLLSLSSPEEIAAFAGNKLPAVPRSAEARRPGEKLIFVSDLPRGFRHRAYSKSTSALCGVPPAQSKWLHEFNEPSALVSRNCEPCRLRDPNEEKPCSQ